MNESFLTWLAQFNDAELLARLLELFNDPPFYAVDKAGRVMFWNQALEELTGFMQSDLLGLPSPISCPLDYPDEVLIRSVEFQSKAGKTIQLTVRTRGLLGLNGQLAGAVAWILVERDVDAEKQAVLKPVESTQNFHGIISRSPAMEAVFQIIQNAAQTEATVLVRGESGSGKELVARAIHDLSLRRQAPFLAINCAALSANLLESELFGHVRGAFTGAIKDHPGLFQRAKGGTLFLDEVAELPLELQAKLLRVIQERNYYPVGGDRLLDVDVRLVAATHRSLREEVKSGQFREDLMYRLRVVPIFLPSLRERREDIPLLLWHFIRLHNAQNFRKIEKIDPQAMRVLLDYHWPGNIRELHNIIEYAFAVGRGSCLRLSELPPEFREAAKPEPSAQTPVIAAKNEEDAIREALKRSSGSVEAAAGMLGMSRVTFWRKRKRYGIE
ncbi:MAG: sigma 54-interacting transcriptional regulator [Methylicorpusculum sp.]|uniref:sigma-54 interaction domain-containing protein n=1 Tax=Methylicorpusculum sp. TaxID=2713644 RepID=UPI00271C9F27|nr:sigma 54-interacting transcriptional regulator [Methylicorpusculum sp.]MDO8938857.1 sigma 54-interacting transcriptional regulator [Methylicorpusculum sp.]MDO9241829.1 sigma 54-interacting transcriptional regulator [Methylicorpusculum sp.]MDP2201556.1 sigma 54-interacting transcriptional regulator [Methylicorpusculum sp.]